MSKFISRTITIGVVLCGICFVTCNFYDATNIEDTPTNKINQNNNMLSMMLETDSGSGQYEMTSLSSWTTDGYVFNSELSKCENGSKLSWDETNKQVVFSGNITDKCYVYFDMIPPTSLIEYVTNLFTGVQGVNNIYHHDGSLENGINDNSYRYAGEDAHPAYYTCKYNGTHVKRKDRSINTFLKGDCATVLKVDVANSGPEYFDKSFYDDIKGYDTVSWDRVNNKCLISSGEEALYVTGVKANETTCTGNAYKLGDSWYVGITIEEIGAGVETLFSSAVTEGVNNFVCFGSSEKPCPTDNLYRIIGVIDGKVKLIKFDYANSNLLGTDGNYFNDTNDINNIYRYKGELTTFSKYYWNDKASKNIWSKSNLNKINLNTNFINNIGSTWANKIATTTWKVGGVIYDDIFELVPSVAYQYEIVNPTENTTYDAKIGLMYVSDYAFAADPDIWNISFLDYSSDVKYNNWMYTGATEWMISRDSKESDYALIIYSSDQLSNDYIDNYNFIRPSFNLEPSVAYKSGNGSISKPIRVG